MKVAGGTRAKYTCKTECYQRFYRFIFSLCLSARDDSKSRAVVMVLDKTGEHHIAFGHKVNRKPLQYRFVHCKERMPMAVNRVPLRTMTPTTIQETQKMVYHRRTFWNSFILCSVFVSVCFVILFSFLLLLFELCSTSMRYLASRESYHI